MRSWKRPVAAIICVLAWLAAASALTAQQKQKNKEQEAQARKANVTNTFSVEQLAPQFYLAVEVEVKADSMTPVRASILRAPARTSTALADLRVRARAGDRVLAEYTIADPRLVEVEREGQRTLPTARTFLHAPLSAELTEIEIVPVPGREAYVCQGGRIDARPLLRESCKEQREVEECRKILKSPAE